MEYLVQPGAHLTGTIQVPGDKSISHRSVIFGSIALGETRVTGLLEGEDVLATIAAFRAMGVSIDGPDQGRLRITGVGLNGLKAPRTHLDMGNSGTAMRLMAGLLSGQAFPSTLVGDESLSSRPMERVAKPLRKMGASITTRDGCPPIAIEPSEAGLSGGAHKLSVASAQLKSALLLAGLYASAPVSVTEIAPTRDHTERMLAGFGCDIQVETDQLTSTLNPGIELQATAIKVPGDISSATFFLAAAASRPGCELTVRGIGLNPTRTGIVNVLQAMGARLHIDNQRQVAGELVGDVTVVGGQLRGIDVPAEWVPLAIDEFPMICIAAANATGVTRVRGAEELRVKESDRISAVANGLRNLGIEVVEYEDGLDVVGGNLNGGEVESYHDHRISMAFTMAAVSASAPVRVLGTDNVATSFPNFVEIAHKLGLNVEKID